MNSGQGMAFGLLDGGTRTGRSIDRLIGGSGYSPVCLNLELEGDPENQRMAFRMVILVSSAIAAATGVLVFFLMGRNDLEKELPSEKTRVRTMINLLKKKSVWLLMIMILCGYSGYKATDIFSLYAFEVMGFDEVRSARTGSFMLYLRPVSGLLAAFLSLRLRSSLLLFLGFILTFTGAVALAAGIAQPGEVFLFFSTLTFSCLGIYSIRALYFTAVGESGIPMATTGAAVGIASFIGYTPDIFMGPVLGILLDNNPGIEGHLHVFILLTVIALIGTTAAFLHLRDVRSYQKSPAAGE